MIEVNDLLKAYTKVCEDLGCVVQKIKDGELFIEKGNDEISIALTNSVGDEMKIEFYKSEDTSEDFVVRMMNLFADTLNSYQI